jgi:hypothetical protein
MEKESLTIHHGKFKRLEKKIKPFNLIGFDTEDDSKGTPTLFAFYSDDYKLVTRSWEEALDFILETAPDGSVFVAHNLEYDFANLMKQNNYVLTDEMIYTSKLIKATLYGTKSYFINSSCFFAGSLATMAKYIDLEKKDGTALDEEYVLLDARIVYEFTKRFQNNLNELGVNLGVTIGQMAMQTYRTSFMSQPEQITYNSPNCLKAYYGGRVEIFSKGVSEKLSVCDINSSYPNVMLNFDYPDTSSITESSIDTHWYGIGRFKIRVPDDIFIPPLPFKGQSGRLYFPTGDITGWWTYAEVRNAIECGCVILKEYEGEGTNSGCAPFKKYITEAYQNRLEAKEKGDKFNDLFWKLWQNNLYGKWAQHKSGAKVTRAKLPLKDIEPFLEHPDFSVRRYGPFYFYNIPKIDPPTTANYLWGVYITSYARIFLHKNLMRVHKEGFKLLYCDTDSIMFENPENKEPFKISKNIGDWSIDNFDLGLFRMSKGYLLCNEDENGNLNIDKVACKGVPTTHAYDFIIRGAASLIKPMRFKEALIQMNNVYNPQDENFLNDIGINVWKNVEKEMLSIDIKRKGVDITYPINVSEIPSLERNSFATKEMNIEDPLHNRDIYIKEPVKKKNKFDNTVIPKDWFPKKIIRTGKYRSKPYFITLKDIENHKGHWFSGSIIDEICQGEKSYFLFLITSYLSEPYKYPFFAKINQGFFPKNKKEFFLKKPLDVFLEKVYILDTGFPSLTIKKQGTQT